MSKRRRWILFPLGVVLLGMGYGCQTGWTPGRVRNSVAAACPSGTSRTEVEAWLDSEPSPPQPLRWIRNIKRRGILSFREVGDVDAKWFKSGLG
jgi:hypothetical protein